MLSLRCHNTCLCHWPGNVYGAVPVNGWRDASIVLMIIHQCVAYALYVTPVFFMWEKLVRTHDKPLWIRLPSRLPVGEQLEQHYVCNAHLDAQVLRIH